jgi:hypothetical protein
VTVASKATGSARLASALLSLWIASREVSGVGGVAQAAEAHTTRSEITANHEAFERLSGVDAPFGVDRITHYRHRLIRISMLGRVEEKLKGDRLSPR